MKNLIILTSILFSALFSYSQCIPDSIYADSTFGVWPTPTTNFPPGEIGVQYYEIVNFKVPRDAGAIDSCSSWNLHRLYCLNVHHKSTSWSFLRM